MNTKGKTLLINETPALSVDELPEFKNYIPEVNCASHKNISPESYAASIPKPKLFKKCLMTLIKVLKIYITSTGKSF